MQVRISPPYELSRASLGLHDFLKYFKFSPLGYLNFILFPWENTFPVTSWLLKFHSWWPTVNKTAWINFTDWSWIKGVIHKRIHKAWFHIFEGQEQKKQPLVTEMRVLITFRRVVLAGKGHRGAFRGFSVLCFDLIASLYILKIHQAQLRFLYFTICVRFLKKKMSFHTYRIGYPLKIVYSFDFKSNI